MSILITGATGQLGRMAVVYLLEAGVPADQVIAGGRDADKLTAVRDELGVETRRVDLADAASITAALDGVQTLLLVSTTDLDTRQANHERAIDAAAEAGMELVVYTSTLNADTARMRLAVEHRATEEYLQASGVPYVILRNGWYIENYTDQLPTILQHGAVIGAAGDGRVSGAARRDLAAAAAIVASRDGHAGSIYELGGATFTLTQMAQTISELSGQDVVYRDLPSAELVSTLTAAGLPAVFAEILADADEGISRGELFTDRDDLAELLGRPPATLAEIAREALPTTSG